MNRATDDLAEVSDGEARDCIMVAGGDFAFVKRYAHTILALRTQLATARREAAEAMREACDDALDDEARRHRSAERDVKATLEERAAAWERGAAIDSARDILRALPLPGDEVQP